VNRVLGSDWLLIASGMEANQRIVERWNPLKRDSCWRQTVSADDQFLWLDSQTLAILKADSSLHALNAESGQLLKMGQWRAGNATQHQRHLLADRDRVYLILTTPSTQAINSELPSLPVNGQIIAFDRRAGGEQWRQEVKNQLLVLDQFANSPVLLFAHNLWEARAGTSTQSRHLLLLDKRTGRPLLEEKFPQNVGGERGVTINLAKPEIEIQGIERVRLIGYPRNP
jgi:hypothetical protein